MDDANHYIIMWSSRGIHRIFDSDAHYKRLMVAILGDKVKPGMEGNHLRSMIVEAVSNRYSNCEIYSVESTLSTEEILREFSETVKQEIRTAGELLFTTNN